MKNSVICLAIFLAGSTVAEAQEANISSPERSAPPPCGRSGSRIVMAGVDMDVQRCKEAVEHQARVQTEDLLIKAQVEFIMTKADLEIAVRRQAESEKRQGELEKLCTEVPDCAKGLHPENPATTSPAPQTSSHGIPYASAPVGPPVPPALPVPAPETPQ